MKHQPHGAARANKGFTLPELLLVMMIIAVMLGMILSAIRALHRHSLRTVALSEVKGIESAWKQYYSHYQCWPSKKTSSGQGGDANGDSGEDATFLIDRKMALALAGDEDYENIADDEKINPDNIPFMEFIHFDKDGSENNNPINPWGLTTIDVNRCYFVRFDNDGDGRIALPDGGDEPSSRGDTSWTPKSSSADIGHTVHASVIVWTYNPEIHVGERDGENNSRNDERIIGSWKD